MEKKKRSRRELKAIIETEVEYEKLKRTGGENPLVEFFTYCLFTSYRAFGKPRKYPAVVELVGIRGTTKRYIIRNDALPEELQQAVDWNLNSIGEYNRVLEELRNSGRR